MTPSAKKVAICGSVHDHEDAELQIDTQMSESVLGVEASAHNKSRHRPDSATRCRAGGQWIDDLSRSSNMISSPYTLCTAIS